MKTFIVGVACIWCGDSREIEVASLAHVGQQPRCPRCNGAVLATDVETKVHYNRTPLNAKDFPPVKMGRPRKWLTEEDRLQARQLRERKGAA